MTLFCSLVDRTQCNFWADDRAGTASLPSKEVHADVCCEVTVWMWMNMDMYMFSVCGVCVWCFCVCVCVCVLCAYMWINMDMYVV